MSKPEIKSEFQPPATEPAATGTSFPTWLICVGLGLLTLALYWPAMCNGFINFDDPFYVSSNPRIQNGLSAENIGWAFSHIVVGNWHPLTMLSHMLDCQLFGVEPWGHHLTNITLHSLNAILVFLVFHRLTGARGRSAWLAALFACHPLRVESVAWIAERKDVLCGFFFLLSLWGYARFAEPTKVQNPKAKVFYAASLLAFALALLSKPMAVTLPFVLLLLDYWPLQRLRPTAMRNLLVEKVPFFIFAAAASCMTFLVQKQEGAMGLMQSLPLGLRCENAVISYCRYLGKIFWPSSLAIFYPHPGTWPLALKIFAGAFLAGVSVWAWAMRRCCPFLLVGWLWFVGMLVPVIGLVQVGVQSMADRYTYLSSVGILLMLVWGAFELSSRWPPGAKVLSLAGLVAIFFCATVTRQQLYYWRNSESLFRHALAVTEDNYIARNNLGNALLNAGHLREAAAQFQAALQLNPDIPETHDNLGNALNQLDATDAAISEFQAALRLNPNYADACNNLGISLGKKGETAAAISEFQAAMRLQPDGAEAHYNLGNVLARTGHTDGAMAQYQTALRLNPRYADAHNNFAILLARAGLTDKAIGHYQAALRSKPDFADIHINLGNALQKKNLLNEAIGQYQIALQLKPDFADGHVNLGNLFLKQNQTERAIAEFQTALRLKPDSATAHDRLGVALGGSGKIDEAIAQFQEALRLQPENADARSHLVRALELKNAPPNR